MKKDQRGAIVESLLIIVVVGILGFTVWYVYHARQNSDKNLSNAAVSGQSTPVKPGASTPAMSSGTDNQSLQSDLNSVDSSQNQASQDNNSSGAAINDQQNEVSVPTQ